MTAAKEGRARMPKGKRQMLCILDEQVIEQIKIAAVRSNSRISHVVQQALEQWLERQKIATAGANPNRTMASGVAKEA